MLAAVLSLLMLGCIAGMCVPVLPRGVPRRGVDLISWVTALEGDGLGVEQRLELKGGTEDSEETGRMKWVLQEGAEVEDVDRWYGDRKVRYPVK